MQTNPPNSPYSRRLHSAETINLWQPQPISSTKPERTLIPTPGETAGLILLALSLYAAFSIIENASWVRGLLPLIIPILAALALGRFAAAKSRPLGYALVLASGIAVTLGLGLPFLDDGAHTIFGLLFLAAAWFVTHLTLRLSTSLKAILIPLPGLLLVLIALAFLDNSYFFHLPLFLIASTPAVAFFHLQRQPAVRRKTLLSAAVAAGMVLSLATLAFTWPAPSPNAPVRPAPVATLEEPVLELFESGSGLFNNIPSRKNWLRFDLRPVLPFTSPVELNDTLVMRVSSPEAHRWRVRVYETYTPQGWISIPDAPRTPEDLPSNFPPPEPQAARQEVRTQVRIFSSNTHVATAGLPIRSTVSGLKEISPQPAFNLYLDRPEPFYLPPDVAQFRENILDNSIPTVTDLELDLAAGGLILTVPPTEDTPIQERNLTVHRLKAGSYPTTALMFSRRQNPPRSYAAIGSVSTATPLQLQNASHAYGQGSIIYPDWIADRYLQLPPNFPQPVRDLAQQLAQGHDNVYDVAMSIQEYLHALKYGEQVVPPPLGVDAVEWFLTNQRVGFCSYFASSMITMLRSLDIPARLVVGFAPGEWDEDRNAWMVRTKDYHAWPEVYFPEYGWVEFEPTPSGVQPSLRNLGSQTAPAGFAGGGFDEECFGNIFECEEALDPAGGIDEFNLDDLDFTPIDRPVVTKDGSPLDLLFRPIVLWPLIALALTAFAIVAANLYLRFLSRRLGLPVLAFAGVAFLAGLAGLPRNNNETPTEYGARLAAHVPRYATLVESVVAAYERTMYGHNKRLDDDAYDNLRWSWGVLRWPFIRLAFRRLSPF